MATSSPSPMDSAPPGLTQLIIIVATSPDGGIGCSDGTFPWDRVPEDAAFFHHTTSATPCALLLGANTWRGSPGEPRTGMCNMKFGARTPYVVSSTLEGAFSTPEEALEAAVAEGHRTVYVCGGRRMYEWALKHPLCDTLYRTQIPKRCVQRPASVSFPTPDHTWSLSTARRLSAASVREPVRVETWSRPCMERQYAQLLHTTLQHPAAENRTAVPTRSTVGQSIEGWLTQGDTLVAAALTTKKVFWKGVREELLWFLRGSTDSKELEARGVRIWQKNTSRAFLDARGLGHYAVGELGPGYGFQWRRAGEREDGTGGVDQLAEAVRLLRNDPSSRRIIVSAWNVADLSKMALPPCHFAFQFLVEEDWLHCIVSQRSADLFLGVPFNLASYGLLTALVANHVGMRPGKLRLNFGSAHIYENHVEQVRTQLERLPYPPPRLVLRSDAAPWEVRPEDIAMKGYRSHPRIAAEMVE